MSPRTMHQGGWSQNFRLDNKASAQQRDLVNAPAAVRCRQTRQRGAILPSRHRRARSWCRGVACGALGPWRAE